MRRYKDADSQRPGRRLQDLSLGDLRSDMDILYKPSSLKIRYKITSMSSIIRS